MIDYLIFNEELDAIIKQLQHSKDPKVKLARLMIIGTMQKYEKRVSEFESDMAPKEEVDILKMSPNRDSSFMSNYQNANMRDYDDTKKYSEKDL